jgi:Ku protein
MSRVGTLRVASSALVAGALLAEPAALFEPNGSLASAMPCRKRGEVRSPLQGQVRRWERLPQTSVEETSHSQGIRPMAPRAYWKGYLRLSLVTCPIELYPATSLSERTHFHMINRKNAHRLHQQMVDDKTGEVVDRKEKGRGYEVGKGRIVEVDDEELAAVQIESTRTIDIDSFVPRQEIDNRYLDKPYYMTPGGKVGVEAFAVIRDAMKNQDRVALGRVVMAHREHVIALEPFDKGLLGTTLRYDYEVRPATEYFAHIASARISKDMVALAEHILDSKAGHFAPEMFKDRYEEALKALVKRKAAGKKIETEAPPEKTAEVIDLMEALKRSLHGGKSAARRGRSRTTRRRTTGRARKAA